MARFRIIYLLVCVFLSACAATPTAESTGEYLDSSAITAKVKAKLVDKMGAAGFSIKVKTFKEEVQLSGFVNNASVKKRAGQVAASVPDVKSVRNNIIIKSEVSR